MTTINVGAFLFAYTGSTCLLVVTDFILTKQSRLWLVPVLTTFAFVAAVAGFATACGGSNIVLILIQDIACLDRSQCASIALGSSVGLLAAFALRSASTFGKKLVVAGVHLSAVTFGLLLVLKEVISPFLIEPERLQSQGFLVTDKVVNGFRIEEMATLNIAPTSVAVDPDGHVFVSGYGGMAMQCGVIVRLDWSTVAKGYVETQVAQYLNRVHGIAFKGKDLYVSRAGQFCRAEKGRIIQLDTGAVTRLSDLDGDGVYDWYEDVVAGLPGAHLPDGMHQNNGIAFDKDGYLYITVGASQNHGPPTHKHAGTILRARPDGTELTVWARGFRNPYGLTFGPGGGLFCTDNDSDDTNQGDRLLHVRQGQHYGHPYTAFTKPLIRPADILPPLYRSQPALEGLAFAPRGVLPPGFDEYLYVAAFGSNEVLRIKLYNKGNTYSATADHFARISQPVAITVANDGTMYVCSYNQKKIFRIKAE